MRARALLVEAPREVCLRDVDLPEPEAGEVLVEAAYTCVSPGTELREMSGAGGGTAPYVPGYALAGCVRRCGPGVASANGERVLIGGTERLGNGLRLRWGGHISHAIVRADQMVRVPDAVPLLDAAVARLAAIAYHGLRLSRPLPHETVAVLGLGPIGLFAARLHEAAGARTVAFDRRSDRVAKARSAGLAAFVADESAYAATLALGADIVVDATGAPAAFSTAVRLARELPWDDTPRTGARVLIQGSYANALELPYEPVFQKELTLLFPRNVQRCDLEAVLDLIARGRLIARDVADIIADPREAPAVYRELARPDSAARTAVFRWNPELA